jgi:hypothetical protein
MMFETWLSSTRELQIQSFGGDPAALEGEELVEYIRWNMLAAIDELMEALHEVHWKPWAKGERGFRNRDAFVNEIVDLLHFSSNCLVAAKCSDDELSARYALKQQTNRARMASGTYDGVKEKCPVCQRAYDDSTVKCKPAADDFTPYICRGVTYVG